MGSDEETLTGNVTTGVVRVGDTVRRPVGPWTDTVDALLEHLHAVGFIAAPRPLGRLGDVSRLALATMLGRRTRAMYDMLREGAQQQRQPWARIWTEDGPYWLATTKYLDEHRDAWQAALE
ncbi:hypothetical protein GA0070613_2718 [Micromonospora inositola]|uniref:Uncharacterized protein n=1 Tax=Micromonospora inositola TaxID=47865 RepID=A0A1C5IEF5_9ACTN|nr:hypothetical protein [Micromonospora inositola]SCG56737.1 hypothetical protein GA0070613_2718 [Micromonospora inositola]